MRRGTNIYKRQDGRWEGRFIKGYEMSGKAKYGFCYGKTYGEAKEKLEKNKAALIAGRPIQPSVQRRRLVYFCDEWLRQRRGKVRESTYEKYYSMVTKHILPRMGGYFATGITSATVDSFSHGLLYEDGLSVKTVHDILSLLHNILKYISAQYPGIFPAVEINYPRENRRETRVLNREEQERFASFLLTNTDPCKLGVLLMLLTGMRIGEICALTWDDVHLKEKSIHITGTLQRRIDDGDENDNRTKLVIGEPKSFTSARTIPMPQICVRLCRRLSPHNPMAYVLTGREKFMEPRVLQYRIEKYTRACGLEGVHAHTLRHTFATRAVEVGFEIKSLSEVMGHSTTSITMERYVHSSMEMKRNNMNKLSESVC